MRQSNSNYDAQNQDNSKPRFILELDSLTNDYASGEFSGRNTSTQPIRLGLPRVSNNELDPIRPRLDQFGTLNIDLLDKDNEITNLLSNNSLLGREVTLKSGFEEIAESDFINFFSGKIIDYPLSDDLLHYQLKVETFIKEFDTLIFQGISETELIEQVSQADFETTLAQNVGTGQQFARLNIPFAEIEVDDAVLFNGGGNEEVATVEDVRVDQATALLEIQVTLSFAYNAGDTVSTKVIACDDVANFYNAVPANPPFSSGLAVLIGQEIIRYDSKNSSDDYLRVTSSPNRTWQKSVRSRHTDTQTVKECWLIQDDPIELALNVLTTTAAGTNGSFDLGISGFGAGIDEGRIDIASLQNIQANYFGGKELRYQVADKMTLEDFLRDIAISAGLYWFITADGLLSARKVAQMTTGLVVDTIVDNDFSWPEKIEPGDDYEVDNVAWAPAPELLINEVELAYNWVPGVNKYMSRRVFELSASKTQYGFTRRLKIESKGIRNNSLLIDIITDYLNVLGQRYANPPTRVEFGLKWRKHRLEAGDVVDFESTFLPNLIAGDRNLGVSDDVLMELVKVEPDVETNEVRCAGLIYGHESHVSIGTSDSVNPADNQADFNATNSDAVQNDDGIFDNTAEMDIAGTRVIVTVRFAPLGTGPIEINTVTYTIRIGDDVHLATMTVETQQTFSQEWRADQYASGEFLTFQHVFNGLTSAKYDVKLDYHSRNGGEVPDWINMIDVTIETDGTSYSEIL